MGGGITGLTAAYRLKRLLPRARIELFESSDRLGGVLDTHRTGELLVERGADSFLNTHPEAVELCRELGLSEELIPTNSGERRALIVRGGRCHPVPQGFVVIRPHRVGPLLSTPLLSWRGKLRVLKEPWIRPPVDIQRADYDESVATFATRRMGREVFEWLVQPLLAGIYTADPYKLSLAATMPDALAAEREFGSLLRAAKCAPRNESGARYANFVTLRGGLARLTHKLADQLPAETIGLNSPVRHIARSGECAWRLSNAAGETLGEYAGVVVAAPAPRAAEMIEGADSELAALLRKISYASSAVVSLALRRDEIGNMPAGFGLVVPTAENRPIVAASFSSAKFPARAPDSHLLVRVFLGGSLRPDQMDLSDAALEEIALKQMRELLSLRGKAVVVDIARWSEKMPQYHVGHLRLVKAIQQRAAELPRLSLAGNAYHGVGIPQCIRSADDAARRLAEQLAEK